MGWQTIKDGFLFIFMFYMVFLIFIFCFFNIITPPFVKVFSNIKF
ncbi:hypothetical protein P296_00590 [Salmonella enterica subsp. arizonae serovar 18:z4,z23:- str. CVM N26624]|uniref:Uncharacterized protein n=1 Tax=Salmonella enterica subsp. arizonae serovar 18:z4,z23:- str. CVM N26626 TaxID=1395119 RepID=A0A3S5YHS6_SALER|nr:hypothetical protein P298_18710 [Salmonella enterica subsp. arizonae serovar 18:z4,z23:- str. CVM N26626]OLV97165.1 hypothetical protein P297_17395 [Salmonella enterica subsp. arizonae serovar 18:z4,z23:- str. CVM N26625]OLW02096.1 hypothetical protein P296_00590 [Salmonella enterica subsp. arizonae serovar 18:z4,z23:- str. CVM N26624]OLW06702.1 hypothetical protein P295_20145 [Salmonella enterica subsp. arizonae serovar 18:z4,z23:- str. CVM N25373]OLW08291.1 hypothetical protein P292_21425 